MFGAVRQYSLPLLLAVALHGVALAMLTVGYDPSKTETRLIKPQIVKSTLLVLEPKAKPKPRPKISQPQPIAQPKPAPTVEPEPVQKKPEPELAKPDPEIERQRRLDEERQLRLNALAESAFMDAVADESETLEEGAAAEAEQVAQSYRYGIYQQVVANWSRPPSARNGMEAKLLVELVPTGDVVAVTLMDSSGSGAFDRSAEAAVKKSRRFDVPRESELFERYFRRFTLLFKPEDLLR